MGHEVESAALARGHTIAARVDPVARDADRAKLDEELVSRADVAVEFALAEAVFDNARVYSRCRTPAVVGTTGWEDQRRAVQELYRDGGALLWGSNFSVGAHMFLALVGFAAEISAKVEGYDVLMYEIHHKRKKDSPSGTALTIAEQLLDACASAAETARGEVARKRRIVTDRLDRRRDDEEIHVASVRGGETPGIHTVMFDSAADTIELRHTARNRNGFAVGAVLAAEWLVGRTGFFRVEDFIAELLGKGDTA